MKMKILVTGGAGYIGSVLMPMLLNNGHEVIVLDNFMYNQKSLLDCCHNIKKITIIEGDVRDRSLISNIFNKYATVNFVFPLACIVGAEACDKDPLAARTINLNAIKLLTGRAESKIIFPNTNSGYGIGKTGIHCTEESPLNPVSLYGQLKVAAEKKGLENSSSIVLRLATVFGISPRMRRDLLVNDFVYTALNQGYIELSEKHFKRNYIHVRDVARAFIHCMVNFDRMKGQTYNLGLSDANLSKLELCEEIKKQIPKLRIYENENRRDPDQRNYIVSNEKIEATGFKPQASLQEGIKELIRAFPIISPREFT